MSLHGRIFVEKNLVMEKQRRKEMENHYKSLNQIKDQRIVIKQKLQEMTRGTDQYIKYKNNIREQANDFNQHGK